MKLASLRQGRDGRLIVVSADLAFYTPGDHIAATLQSALDDWSNIAPRLRQLSIELAMGEAPSYPLDQSELAAPLPRAYQWVDGSAYVNHVDLVRKARGAQMPESYWVEPLMYQGASDEMLAARSDIVLADETWGCDFEGEVVVVTGDIPAGASREQALRGIVLVGILNDISLRSLIPTELAKGFGFVQSKPACAVSPVFVTPEELGDRWRDGKLHGPLNVEFNGASFGCADAGIDMTFDFGELIAHLARTRNLVAGTMVGSGTVSNRGLDGGPGATIAEGGQGYSCIAEIRSVETLLRGEPLTPYLKRGDKVRIWMNDNQGRTIFGAIEQLVVSRE
jgi:fumarylacetoacetate (FAA) hydrolase